MRIIKYNERKNRAMKRREKRLQKRKEENKRKYREILDM